MSAAVDVYALGTLLLFAATGHYPRNAANAYMLFQVITDPRVEPDLSERTEELVPLLSAMLAQAAPDRPSPAEVVRGCREVVESQGMKIAQARRRLTSYTTSLARQGLVPAQESLPPTAPHANPPGATALTVPRQQAPAPTTPDPLTGTPAAREAAPEQPPQPRSSSGTVLHSAQARRTADQLRRTYAARASL